MWVSGVDENGLGPVLGPMVVTCVSLEVARYQGGRLAEIGRELGIDDSKATAAFGRMALAEGLVLAVLEHTRGTAPADAEALLSALLLDAPEQLQTLCPIASHPQCWSARIALPCFGGDIEQGREALASLSRRGIRLRHARSAVACTRLLNERLGRGQSRVELDLELMERLLLDAYAHAGEELRAICGMVGGIRNYADKLRHIPREHVAPRRASQGAKVFDVAHLGHIRFEIDADQRHLPVALASMIGKYLRELWMLRHNRFYQTHEPTLSDVSGYHDPITRGFIRESAAVRKRLGVDDGCFLRDSAKDQRDRQTLPLFPE